MEAPRVLLVDDEVALTRNLAKLLSKRGCEVSAVNDGQSAMEKAEEDDLDVMVLDMKMPGIGGMEVLKHISVRKPSLQVIILTGHATVESAIKGLHLGAFDYMTKPIDIDDLAKKIFQAFERRKRLGWMQS